MSGHDKSSPVDISSEGGSASSVVQILSAPPEAEIVDISSSSDVGGKGTPTATDKPATQMSFLPSQKRPAPSKKSNKKLAHMKSRRPSMAVAGADFLCDTADDSRATPSWARAGLSDDGGSSEESGFDVRPKKTKSPKKKSHKK